MILTLTCYIFLTPWCGWCPLNVLTLLTEFVQTDVNSDWHAVLTPANVNVIWDVITAGELRWFIWENVEVDRIISAFSFSNYGFIAVQFFNSILLVYYKTLKEHKTVLYWVFEDRNYVRSLKLSQRLLALRLVFSISVWGIWRHFCPQKLNRVQFCVL